MSDELATAEAVTQLVEWVMDPRPKAWTALADGLPLALFDAPPAPLANRSALDRIAAAALDPTPGSDDGRSAPGSGGSTGAAAGAGAGGPLGGWCWRHGRLAVASAGRRQRPFDIGSVLVVDDRDDSLSSAEGEAAWRCWLALSNILGHASRPVRALGLSQVTGASPAGEPAEADETQPAAGLPAPWQELLGMAVDDTERALLRGLAEAGAPLPEQGYETDDGYPLDLAWPAARIAVLTDPDDSVTATLTADGWQVAGPDLDRILELLKGAGERR